MNPDVLVMTATPIPRSLVMSVYGDLDLSIIDEMPPGRKSVITTVRGEDARRKIYQFLDSKIREGSQVYIVYPLVEESEKLDLLNATQMAEHLQTGVFPNFRVGLIHGRMKQNEKDAVMDEFRSGEIHILVSTTVIEVGVDVPNASIMIVEHAERFGLSQLHQLRGRVGRGVHPSTCVLLYQFPLSEDAKARLRALVDTTDGFVIAERDLEIRGPGDFFGTRQSGIPTLRVGDLQRDHVLMEEARREAVAWLDDPASRALAAYVSANWAARFGLVGVA
jgi:ATP-dependent DNA helicase RecG